MVMLGAGAGTVQSRHLSRAVTADSRKVFFDTEGALVPQDTNEKFDVYEYDIASGEVHLISSGKSSTNSFFDEATPDGSDVFFTTRERLVAQDVDGSGDLYDARVGGGIAAQEPVPAAGCSGEGCQGTPAVQPGTGSLSSSVLAGVGNLPAPASGPVVKTVKHTVKKKPKSRKKAKAKRKRRGRNRARRSAKSVSRQAGR
jgi:hypothetical protein